WDFAQGKAVSSSTKVQAELLFNIAFSPDGRRALTGDSNLTLWDVENGKRLFSLLKSSGDMPVATQARFSSDGRFVAVALRKTGSASTPAEENVRVWDVASGKGLAQTGSAPLVRQMEFSPDNRFLISGGADGMARIWEVS